MKRSSLLRTCKLRPRTFTNFCVWVLGDLQEVVTIGSLSVNSLLWHIVCKWHLWFLRRRSLRVLGTECLLCISLFEIRFIGTSSSDRPCRGLCVSPIDLHLVEDASLCVWCRKKLFGCVKKWHDNYGNCPKCLLKFFPKCLLRKIIFSQNVYKQIYMFK